MATETPQKKKPAKGFYILVAVLAGNVFLMFGLIWLSEVNHPELVEPHYYTAGSIDSVKQESNDNRRSGWFPSVRYGGTVIQISVRDSLRRGVSGLHVSAALYRPSSDLLDRPEQAAIETDSSYNLPLQSELEKGLWNVLLTVSSHDGKRLHKRIPLNIE